ncbi:hypothetical protein ANN_07770 [Periplaneta americana]|uniref:DUF659 domain-containing protein n=1 Tax=Periplaneta americana TaxID=6978 RepID=A0ABQ8T134_PERAM|nr:hypothetical protein ANN_07770 [Periplaneta americana]
MWCDDDYDDEDDDGERRGEGMQNDKTLLFANVATYIVKAGKFLKSKYNKIIHIICLAHAHHRIADEVRFHFPEVDRLIANVKKVFVKAPSCVSVFKKQCLGVLCLNLLLLHNGNPG